MFCDRGLADIHAEFQKLTVDLRRAPEHILLAHGPRTNIRDTRSNYKETENWDQDLICDLMASTHL